ncbi:MAG: flagellar hook-length control protein FliK [Methylobacter sp.]
MDINSAINTQSLFAANRLLENTLNLKVNQQLDVKVIKADIQAAKNTIALALGGKDVIVQSNRPIELSSGQDLKIQITKVAPIIEFKVLETSSELKELRLKLISTTRDSESAAIGKEPMRPAVTDGESAETGKESVRATSNEQMRPAASEKQLAIAKIASIIGNKIQLQMFPTPAGTDSKQTAVITIERFQLTNAPWDLKAGQNLNLEIIKTGTTPEFKIIPAAVQIPEAKIAEFTKLFLPRHEASPIFLNQLLKDLPKLTENNNVPQALKDIAIKIVQNLPPKEQLITSQGLKQAIANSGLFLEAKMPAQAELIKELPQLIKNESIPQSLQRIAAEILQNLTQKEPLLNGPSNNPKPVHEADLLPSKLNSAGAAIDAANNTPKAGALNEISLVAEDFKANLLKFIQALKHEIVSQAEQPSTQADLDLFKNLQHKTENTIAKLALDQLMSLPKEESPKQLWLIDIPFIDRQQAQSVRIEVQRDKENNAQSGNGNWSVNITLTPPGLDTIHCIASYQDNVINTFFKSRNTQTTELIKHHLDYLKNQFEESGLKTGHMGAHDGAQKTQLAHPNQLSQKKLFDDNA